jgi:hypothetical protein
LARAIKRLVTCFGEQLAERREGCECELCRLYGRHPATDREHSAPVARVELAETGPF